MPAGRPRKPTAILEAAGAFEKNPKRKAARKAEPAWNGPIGPAPKYFDANHRAVWRELSEMAPEGVLAKSDRAHLELATRLLTKMRLAPARMPKWLRKLGEALEVFGMSERDINEMKDAFRAAIGVNAQELSLLSTTLTRMGMTPADRSRVNAKESDQPQADPLANLMAKLSGAPRIM